jgi:Cu/Ag efflux protein CusF
MKTTMKQTLVLATVLATAAAFNAAADQPQPVNGPEDWYTGQVTSVDPHNRTLDLRSSMLSNKEFSLGSTCSFGMLGVNNASLNDIRPGQKLTVRYFESQGVRIVDRVQQEPMQYEGMVKTIDPNMHTLTFRQDGFDKTMAIADGCSVMLRDNKGGMLKDIQPGDHVTVSYETPDGKPIARQIAQTSAEFTGTLTAIDLDSKIVKAKGGLETKEFNLADNCTIVINGRTDGKLSELRPDERLQFNYDSINGVNVVNRIGPAAEQTKASVTSSPSTSTTPSTPTYPGYPTGY